MPSAPPEVFVESTFDADAVVAHLLADDSDPWAASYATLENERDLAYGQLFRTTQDMRKLLAERDAALEALSRAHHQTLLRLAVAAEYKDGDTGAHIVRLGVLSEILALRFGQTEAYARMLRLAAPMHDVGKIGIPDAVLKKAGPLTAEEWQVMRQHPDIGARILGESGIAVFEMAGEVARGHHEKWDGSGYPRGLSGEDIPLSARIVALVDFFDALTMDRVYRPRFSDTDAIALVCEQRGRHFDPDLVDVFLDCVEVLIAARDDVNARGLAIEDLLKKGDCVVVPGGRD